MNPRLIAIQARREILISAAQGQRVALALDMVPLRAPLALADQGLALLRLVRRHPLWIVAGLAAVALAGPRGAGTWLQRSWAGWQLVQRLRAG